MNLFIPVIRPEDHLKHGNIHRDTRMTTPESRRKGRQRFLLQKENIKG